MKWTNELKKELLATRNEKELRDFCDKYHIKFVTAERAKRQFRQKSPNGFLTVPVNNTAIYYENQINALHKEVYRLKKEIGFQETIKEVSENKIKALPKVKEPKISKKSKKTIDEIGVLLFSDLHIGEKVDKDEMGGINEYNFDIFSRRLEQLANGILSIKEKMQGYNMPHLEIAALGDILTGDIKDELIRNSENTLIEGLFDGALVISQFLSDLLTSFKSIHFTGIFGNHGRCFDKETELLTKKGYKKYNEIHVGQEVATINLSTNKTEWQKIEDIIINKNEPEMCFAKTSSVNISVTPDHTMIVWDNRARKFKRKYAKTIWSSKKGGATFPTSFPSGNLDFDISNDLLKFMAWVITDGSIYTKGGLRYYIYQSKPKYIKEIEQLLQRLNIKYKHDIRTRIIKEICGKKLKQCKNQHCFRISIKSSKKLYALTKLGRKYKLPSWMQLLSDKQVKLFLNELIKGDGHKAPSRRGKNGYIRKSSLTLWGTEKILTQIQQLLITHGIACSLNEQRTRKGTFYLQIRRNNTVHILGKKKQIIFYNDISWCVSVPNQTLLLRRKGKPFIAGNTTKEIYFKKAYVNWDYIIYKIIALMMKDNHRITFNIPKSFWTIREIGGRRLLFLHGNNIKSWSGIPHYGIQRAVYKLTELLGSNNKHFSDICMAHFHSASSLSRTKGSILLNGSIIGSSEYSVGSLFVSTEPNQLFFGINPKNKRLTWKFNIDLSNISETTGRYKY